MLLPLDESGRVTLYHVPSGTAVQRWPVDAREALSHPESEYALEMPVAAAEADAPAPSPVAAPAAKGHRHTKA